MGKSFGFIGTGNMGSALATAAANSMDKNDIFLNNRTMSKAEALAEKLGCKTASAEYIAANCDYIFLGVKPQMMAGRLASVAEILAKRHDYFVLVSMAGGLTMAEIRTMAGADYPVIRIMPNTPVSVGCGLIQYDRTENVTDEALEIFLTNMAWGGILDALPENLIDAGSALAGSGPAFADMFIEALADGAVACGLPRAKAMVYAAQMLQGAARLMLESGKHPGELKDAVCSPGGSTIVGVRTLEQRGFRAACMEAVEATFRRSKELGK